MRRASAGEVCERAEGASVMHLAVDGQLAGLLACSTPSPGWLLSPMIAALAMSLSSVSVIGNALRLRKARLATSA